MNLKPYQSTYESLQERLDKAFQLINDKGIAAKQRHTCCGSCGIAEFKEDEQYVFYHDQGFDSMIETGAVHLNWDVANVNDIYEALKDSDLLYEHDGDPDKTIEVFQSRTYVEPEFSLEQSYNLWTPEESPENLVAYFGDLLAMFDDCNKPNKEDAKWLQAQLKKHGMTDDLKYLNAL